MMFRFYFKALGGHTHVRLFAGNKGDTLGLCGALCFRSEEWASFRSALERPEHRTFPPSNTIEFIEEDK